MKKNLVICPTRGRPERCMEMCCSATNTARISDFVFYYDDDDPKARQYLYVLSSWETIRYFKGPRMTTTEIFNQAYAAFPDYEFYCMTNDDFIFKTDGWDEMLCRKGRICYGNDLCAGVHMPTCPVIDGNIVRALGWLQMPSLKYMYGDAVWKMIGNKLGILKYVPQVVIEHNHWLTRKVEIDETYKNTNSPATYAADEQSYRWWMQNDLLRDVEKIRVSLGLC